MAIRWFSRAAIACALLCLAPPLSRAQDDLSVIKQQILELQRANAEKDRLIRDLQLELGELKDKTGTPSAGASLDEWVNSLGTDTPRVDAPSQAGTPKLRLVDISADLLVAAAASSERDAALSTLQGGGHDPNKRGFTLQQMELSLCGAVDPYFTGEIHAVSFIDSEGETGYELEEAFGTTTCLPFGLQLEAGHFLTEFGRINPQHAHQWHFLDQPVIHNRVFGGDGQRQVGARLGWLTPLPWFSEIHVGIQNAKGETMPSFLGEPPGAHHHGEEDEEEEEGEHSAFHELLEAEGIEAGIGGRPIVDDEIRDTGDFVYLLRWDNGWDLSDSITAKLGASALFGPNLTGPDGRTNIYGGDLLIRWRPSKNDGGWPFVSWESEFVQRDYKADDFHLEGEVDGDPVTINLDEDTYRDWGITSQVQWGFKKNWVLGGRVDYATGERDDFAGGEFDDRSMNPFRDDRTRLSAMLTWHPSHFSRVRLQYNYDQADHLRHDGLGGNDRSAHTVFFGLELTFGAHPAHKY